MTGLSIFLWSFCLFFLLSWIFVLGILVGRGFLPDAVTVLSDLKSQIGKLQAMVNHDRSYDIGSKKEPDPDPKLAFYEKLSSKKGEAKEKWVPEKKFEDPKKETPPVKVEAYQPALPEIKEKESTEILNKQLTSVIDTTQYTVQLASLEDGSKAEKMVNQLIERGYPAYFYEAKLDGKTYYRIRCGRFMSREEAGNYAGKVAREFGIKGFVSRLE